MSADDKADASWDDYVSQQQEEKIEELERQLNAANQRIKRLEDGDAALTYSIGLDLQKENEALKARIKQLEDARTVAAANSLANMLAYEDAVAKIKRLVEAGDRMDLYAAPHDSDKWNEAKEAKP